MGDLERSLGEISRRLEPEIQSRLKGFLGGFLRAYLPQTWVFRSGEESASLTVDPAGHATVAGGSLPDPDVTVEIPVDRLRSALAAPSAARGTPTGATVTTHTAKGKAAFGYLRDRLGI